MSAIIDKKYINLVSPQLQKFKWKGSDLANCRCPICGDSQRNKNKARGFFFPKKNDFYYKCHNCGIGHTMYKFLEIVAPVLCREYALERWRGGENGHSNYTKPDETAIARQAIKISLPRISELDADHAARKYCEGRLLPHTDRLYFSDSFGDWVRGIDPTYSTVPNDERIVIPFLNKSGELLGVQGRAIGGSKSAIRYITVKFAKDGRMFFGGDTVDYSRRVYATEGPLDSFFWIMGLLLLAARSEMWSGVLMMLTLFKLVLPILLVLPLILFTYAVITKVSSSLKQAMETQSSWVSSLTPEHRELPQLQSVKLAI